MIAEQMAQDASSAVPFDYACCRCGSRATKQHTAPVEPVYVAQADAWFDSKTSFYCDDDAPVAAIPFFGDSAAA